MELWSTAANGNPSQKFRDLTTPSSVTAGNMEFAAPAGTTLAASTTYCVVFKSDQSGRDRLGENRQRRRG